MHLIYVTTVWIHVVFYHESSVQQQCRSGFLQYNKLGVNIVQFTSLFNTILVQSIERNFNLLNTQGWKQLKRHARTVRMLIRTLKKSKYRQAKATNRYKHGWEVPQDYSYAIQLDVQNDNTKWKGAIDLEIEQIKEYHMFKDHGKVVDEKAKVINAPKEHQKIRVHFVFDVKHYGKFKSRLVADGHLTKEPNETVY